MRTNRIDKNIVAQFSNQLNEKHNLIFRIGLATGLRVSDIIRLKNHHLKIEKPTITEMKTGKKRRVYLPKKLRAELINYYAENSYNDYIFYSKNSKSGHISRQAVWKAFKKASNQLNIKSNIAPHSTRKNYACKLLNKGKSYNYIKGKLNHSSLSDTLLYLTDELFKEE